MRPGRTPDMSPLLCVKPLYSKLNEGLQNRSLRLNRLTIVARILLAIPLLVFGLDGLFGFLPADSYPEHGEQATRFLEAIMSSGYLWETLKILEVAIGVALLSGRFVPLALAALTPIVVNILGFHVTMEQEGTGLALVLVVLLTFLAWAYREHLQPVLAANAKPDLQNSEN
jgi:uncharacterized membrane protein YphA (DoxX/SURF4 family)